MLRDLYGKPVENGCHYNANGVECLKNGRHCESCGWNPSVAKRRSILINRTLNRERTAAIRKKTLEQELQSAKEEIEQLRLSNRKLCAKLSEFYVDEGDFEKWGRE